MSAFIDAHPHFGVEPICRVLEARPGTYYEQKNREPSARSICDAKLKPAVQKVWEDNRKLYGVRKLWHQLLREGHELGRDQTARLMRELGIAGLRQGKAFKTTRPDSNAERPKDLVDRNFVATKPNELWVTDFTYVPTWSGMAFTALVLDVFSRKIVGWRTASTMKTSLVLDALEMAVWARDGDVDGVIHHSDAGSQYTSIKYSDRLAEIGAAPSIGSVGDAFDNAMAESLMGTYKNELIKRQGPWRNVDEVELATLSYIDWYNNKRLHGELDYVPPTEFEEAYYRERTAPEKEAEIVAI